MTEPMKPVAWIADGIAISDAAFNWQSQHVKDLWRKADMQALYTAEQLAERDKELCPAKDAAIQQWNLTGEQQQKADDVLRYLSSWLGQGGMHFTEVLNYEEVQARIVEGFETIVKVEVERAKQESIKKLAEHYRKIVLATLEECSIVKLTEEEMTAMRCLDECFADGEGYDVDKAMMKNLAKLGVIRHVGGSRYEFTVLGNQLLVRII